ncbi:MAG: flotillin domain-containing protein, partial [Thermodesulfobacteriota bacterium]
MALTEKSREQALIQAELDQARLTAVKAEEQVITAREVEIAERQKAVEILEARKKAEREAIGVVETAEARMKAAVSQAETVGIVAGGEAGKIKRLAEAEAEAELVKAKAAERRYKVNAEGARAMHEAENLLDPGKSAARIKMAVIEHLAEIVRESVKPIEAIEGIKIIQVEGLNPPGGRAGAPEAGGPGGQNLADQLVNSALRYRGQRPLVDAILKEIGLAGGDIHGLTAPIQETEDETPKSGSE